MNRRLGKSVFFPFFWTLDSSISVHLSLPDDMTSLKGLHIKIKHNCR